MCLADSLDTSSSTTAGDHRLLFALRVTALAAQLQVIALLLAVFAAVLSPFTTFLNRARAGRMRAFG
jgi:hypothetical protein